MQIPTEIIDLLPENLSHELADFICGIPEIGVHEDYAQEFLGYCEEFNKPSGTQATEPSLKPEEESES